VLGQAGVAVQGKPQGLRLDPGLLRQLAIALLVAAVAELALLRLATRIGVHLPKNGVASDALSAASFMGTFALNLAALLSAAFVALLLAAIAWRARSAATRWFTIVLGAAMFWGLGAGLLTDDTTADVVFNIATTLLVVGLGLALATRPQVSSRGRVAIGLIVAAYVSYQYYAVGQLVYLLLGYTESLPAGMFALRLGEALVLLAAAAAFWAWGADRWRQAGRAGGTFAFVPALAVVLTALAPAATMSILALWTTGLTFYLPLPLYAVALAAFLLTIAACWRGGAFWTATGLVLVLLAGYMPEATYYHVAFLLGVAFLAGHAGYLVDAAAPAEAELSRA